MSIYNFKYTHFCYMNYVNSIKYSIIYVVLYIAMNEKGGDFFERVIC